MRVLTVKAPESALEPLLADRRRKGLDRRDEVWEGVLHMVPPPSEGHGALHLEVGALFLRVVRERGLGRLWIGAGVRLPGTGEEDYRVPDLSFVSTGRLSIVRNGWIEGGPDVVVEIRSPGDETYRKIPFYARVGVRELVVIDGDSRKIEVFRLAGEELRAVSPDRDGRLLVEGLGLRLAIIPGEGGPAIAVTDDRSGEVIGTI